MTVNNERNFPMANEFINNENRARLKDSINKPTDCSSVSRPASPGEMPPGILNGNSVPMTLDSHSGGRHSHENMERPAGEKSRTARTAETRRRLESRTPTYKY
jgi:hypothetical protein